MYGLDGLTAILVSYFRGFSNVCYSTEPTVFLIWHALSRDGVHFFGWCNYTYASHHFCIRYRISHFRPCVGLLGREPTFLSTLAESILSVSRSMWHYQFAGYGSLPFWCSDSWRRLRLEQREILSFARNCLFTWKGTMIYSTEEH